MGNVVRTLRIGRSRRDLPDTPDADLDAEPEELICPITRNMFRDPVMVVGFWAHLRAERFYRTLSTTGPRTRSRVSP
jgi:hypothetical protein